MTEQVAIRKTKKQPNKGVRFMITNATIYYTQHHGYGALEYKKKPVEGEPWKNHRYEVTALINKDIKKVLKQAHKKVSVREVSADDFEQVYNVKPPYEDDEYLLTTFYREAYYGGGKNKGEEAPPVSVISKTGASLREEGIGNGSVANIIVTVTEFDHPEFGKGTSLRLSSMQVVDHVPYDLNSGSDDGLDEFETEDADLEDEFETEEGSGNSSADDDWDE